MKKILLSMWEAFVVTVLSIILMILLYVVSHLGFMFFMWEVLPVNWFIFRGFIAVGVLIGFGVSEEIYPKF